MRRSVARLRILLAGSILVGLLAVAPRPASAACGGGGLGDDGWLARYAGRTADSIILGRLIEIEPAFYYHFELLEVYRGEAPASPIADAAPVRGRVKQVGACVTGERVRPGDLFVYATGARAQRFGPMQLIFPRVPGKGWTFGHFGNYSTLDHLLVLLGVLPATSTVDRIDDPVGDQSAFPWFLLVLALTALGYWALRNRQRAAPL